jgi:hypothetical protein
MFLVFSTKANVLSLFSFFCGKYEQVVAVKIILNRTNYIV